MDLPESFLQELSTKYDFFFFFFFFFLVSFFSPKVFYFLIFHENICCGYSLEAAQ